MNRRIRQLGIVLTVLFFVLFAQLNNIQVLQAAKLQDNPLNNRNAVRDFSSPRGSILTADGVAIAQSVPSGDAYDLQRQYPEGELFGHLTGYFSFNYGNEGLERVYNDQLTGKTHSLRDIGDLLTDRVTTDNVTITVTKRMQQAAKDALGNKRGSVVALNPKTGEVLAMYSNPSYDPNPLAGHNFTAVSQAWAGLTGRSSGSPMLPRAYREGFPPGSTFKVVTSSAAYEKNPGLTRKDYPQNRAISLPLSNKPLSNFGGEVCGGALPELLRVSCNTGFAQMGMDLGAQNMADQANAFGFNQVPPLDEPYVARSRFPSAASFKGRTPFLAYAAIGQGDVSATPLQMALVASAIANHGVIMKPHLLKEIRDQHGNVVEKGKDEAWLRATSDQTAQSMTQNMINVARAGTATGAQIPGIQVAAKTGTAQTHDDLINAWLVSFAPAQDPTVAVAVIVEDQHGGSEATGGRIAAPIAQQVMKAALGAS